MKLSDYIRLGRINIKNRKKSTRNTIVGITVGLSLLVSVIFLTFSLFLGVNSKINETKTIASFSFFTKNFLDLSGNDIREYDDSSQRLYMNGFPSYDTGVELSEHKDITEKLISEYYRIEQIGFAFNRTCFFSVLVDGLEKKALNSGRVYSGFDDISLQGDGYNTLLKVCHLSKSDYKIFSDAEIYDLNGEPLKAGTGFYKKQDLAYGQKQVMLSEIFLERHYPGIPFNDIIGKPLTLSATVDLNNIGGSYEIFADNDTDPSNAYLGTNSSGESLWDFSFLSGFEIVGIISKEYYSLISAKNEAHIFIADTSVYFEENGSTTSLHPELNFQNIQGTFYETECIIATYKVQGLENLKLLAEQRNTILPFYGSFEYIGADSNTYYSTLPVHAQHFKLQAESYGASFDLSKAILASFTPIYKGMTAQEIEAVFQNDAYINLTVLFTVFTVVMYILYAFGGIIFLATLLNLFNSINYSINARRNYIGVMRAIGLKQNNIPRLYFVEMLILFLYALLFIAVLSFGISFILKLAFDSGLDVVNAVSGLNLSLDFRFFPLTLLIITVFMMLVAFVFSYFACLNASSAKILSLLENEQH